MHQPERPQDLEPSMILLGGVYAMLLLAGILLAAGLGP